MSRLVHRRVLSLQHRKYSSLLNLFHVPCKSITTKLCCDQENSSLNQYFACPICFQLFSTSNDVFSPLKAGGTSFRCDGCHKAYHASSQGIIDLTIPASCVPFAASFFQNRYIAQYYDRVYRRSFPLWGFPGFQNEFNMAQEILKPCFGKTIMDLSCAGGSLTRKFLTSNAYKLVVASDYSEPMLRECFALLKNDPKVNINKAVIVKADAGRLPLATSSLAAVHSSAAIHCWPQPLHAVAEIARVLQPGGVFVASTFLFPQAPSPFDKLIPPLRQAMGPLRLWTEPELQEVVEANGLICWKSMKNEAYILFSATKPM